MFGRKLLFVGNLLLCHSFVLCWHHLDQQQDELNRNAWRARGIRPHPWPIPNPPKSRSGNDGEKQQETIEQPPQMPYESPDQRDLQHPVSGTWQQSLERTEEDKGSDQDGFWSAPDMQSSEEQELSKTPSRFSRDNKKDMDHEEQQSIYQTPAVYAQWPAPSVEKESDAIEQNTLGDDRKEVMWRDLTGQRDRVNEEVEVDYPYQQQQEEDLFQKFIDRDRSQVIRRPRGWRAHKESDSSSDSSSDDSSSESDKSRKVRNAGDLRSSESDQSESNELSSSSLQDPGYEWYEGIGIYKFHQEGADSFDEASERCRSEGAHLAIANSKEEADVFVTLWMRHRNTEGDYAYIGIHNRNEKGQFRSVLGDSIASTGYVAWRAGEPNNKNGVEHCVSFFRFGGYQDIPCVGNRPFICEMRWKGEI